MFRSLESSVVFVVGPTCAGKSTTTEALSSLLEGAGLRVRPVALGGFYDVARPLLPLILDVTKLFSRGPSNMSTILSLLEDWPRIFRGLFKLWLVLDTFSVYARFLIEIYVPSKLGYSVIVGLDWACWLADYFYLCRLLQLPSNATSPWTDLVQRLLRSVHPAKTLFLDAETSVLEARWRRRGGVQAWTTIAELRELQRTVTLSLARSLCNDVVRLDSTSRETLTSNGVRQALSGLLPKRTAH